MNVSYEYYRIFYYVASTASFTKAAQILGSSQPNVTRAINNLEAQLGILLFVRSKKGTILTSAGEQLFQHVKIAVEQIQMGEKELVQEKNLEKGSITIGVSEIALHDVLLPILSSFRKKFGGIEIQLINTSTPEAIQSLQEGNVDFALVSSPLPKHSFYEEKIKSFNEYLVAGSMYNTLKRGKYSIEEIASYPFVCLSLGSSTRNFYEALFEEKNCSFKVHTTVSTADQILPMIQAGLGIGFVPESLLKIKDTDLFIVQMKEKLERSICLVYDKKKTRSLAALALMDVIRERKVEL